MVEHNSVASDYDLVIIGAGMAGLSLVHLIRQSIEQGLRVALIERFPLPNQQNSEQPPSFDGRATALSYGTQQIFKQLGLWSHLSAAACGIKNIQVSDQGRFGQTHISHNDAQVDHLGYIIRNRALGQGLMTNLPQALDILAPENVDNIAISEQDKACLTLANGEHINAELVVMADGGRSPLAQQLGIKQHSESYKTHALVTSVRLDRSHNNWAYERFTESGPIALLPLADDEFAVVWTLANEVIEEYLAANEDTLIARLQSAFGYRAGRIIAMGERASYPLALVKAQEQIRPHIVLLGNAAHSLHPVAGQGFNLALRDAAALAEQMNAAFANKTPLGSWPVVRNYYLGQKQDQRNTVFASDVLPKLFSQKNTALRLSRDAGLLALALSPTSRMLFARHAMGLGQGANQISVNQNIEGQLS